MTPEERAHQKEIIALHHEADREFAAVLRADRAAENLAREAARAKADKDYEILAQASEKRAAEKLRHDQVRGAADFNADVMSGLMNGYWLDYGGSPNADFNFKQPGGFIFEGTQSYAHCYLILGGTVIVRIKNILHIGSDIRKLIEHILGVTPLVSTDDGHTNLFYRGAIVPRNPAYEFKPRMTTGLASRYPTGLPLSVLGVGKRYELARFIERFGQIDCSRTKFETLSPFATPRFGSSNLPPSAIERVHDGRTDGHTTWRVTGEPVVRYGAREGSVRWEDLPVVTDALFDQVFR